jgi:hypothetical protein
MNLSPDEANLIVNGEEKSFAFTGENRRFIKSKTGKNSG